MYIKKIKKGNSIYAQLVHSYRENGKVKKDVLVYFGKVEENQIPYLQAAYADEKPTLVYKDGSTFKG